MDKHRITLALAAAATALLALPSPAPARTQTTQLISQARDGGIPNGPSTNPVISQDRRYARIIAFESEASNLVRDDTNGTKDVFAIRRTGSYSNMGERWQGGNAILLSQGLGGAPANGPSWGAAVDGAHHSVPHCVAFLSAASNLVKGDTNGVTDAFVSRGPGGALRRVSKIGRHQSFQPTTAVAISGDCSRVAFIAGGKLYTRGHGKTRKLSSKGGTPANPSFGNGAGTDLVFDAGGDVYMSRGGKRRPKKIVDGGRNPAYNALGRRVVAYEKREGGHWQIAWRDVGHGEHIASKRHGHLGNGDSRHPSVANSGYYIGFETEASNLGTNAARQRKDENGLADTYLYTGVRDLTLVQDVKEYGVPVNGGAHDPSISYYANYFVFDSPAPLNHPFGPRQVFMRWLGAK